MKRNGERDAIEACLRAAHKLFNAARWEEAYEYVAHEQRGKLTKDKYVGEFLNSRKTFGESQITQISIIPVLQKRHKMYNQKDYAHVSYKLTNGDGRTVQFRETWICDGDEDWKNLSASFPR